MTTRSSPWGDLPFSVSDGRARGLGDGAMKGPRFVRPYRGVRQWAASADTPHTDARQGLRRRCEQYTPRLRPGQFFNSEAALVLGGSPTPFGWQPVVHVAAYRPAMPPRADGVVGHRLQTRDPAPWAAHGLPLEHPARAWVQASRLWSPDDLVAAADFLVARRRPLVTLDELRQEARAFRGSALDAVLDAVRDGSESSAETRMRLALVRAGLPEPALQFELRAPDGFLVARLDGAYERWRVAVEYDGRQHAFDERQFRRDAERWDDIRDAGWLLVRILDHHLGGDGRAAAEKVRRALLSAGWRPGR